MLHIEVWYHSPNFGSFREGASGSTIARVYKSLASAFHVTFGVSFTSVMNCRVNSDRIRKRKE